MLGFTGPMVGVSTYTRQNTHTHTERERHTERQTDTHAKTHAHRERERHTRQKTVKQIVQEKRRISLNTVHELTNIVRKIDALAEQRR